MEMLKDGEQKVKTKLTDDFKLGLRAAMEQLKEERLEYQQKTWGPISTILWAVFIAIAFVLVQSLTVVGYIVTTMGRISPVQLVSVARALQYDGLLLSLCSFATLIVCCPLIVGIVKLKRGSNLREYLGLTLPSKRHVLQWFCAIAAFCVLSDVISFLVGEPIVPEFMLKTYASLKAHWILWAALLLAAPLFEELFFRGFIIKGLSVFPLRWYGAVIISSAAWAVVHAQYDIFGVTWAFVLGLILGTGRVKTGSTLLTIFLHSFVNLGATVETAIHLRDGL
jgi:membrane protease YdiL (CAAX protease family)